MKRVSAFRHSLKDGPRNTCGPKGLELATRQGEAFIALGLGFFDKAAHGILVRTAQTLLAFLKGYLSDSQNYSVFPGILPPIEQLGSDELFAEMNANPDFAATAKEIGNFHAVFKCHGDEKAGAWASYCWEGLKSFFDQL